MAGDTLLKVSSNKQGISTKQWPLRWWWSRHFCGWSSRLKWSWTKGLTCSYISCGFLGYGVICSGIGSIPNYNLTRMLPISCTTDVATTVSDQQREIKWKKDTYGFCGNCFVAVSQKPSWNTHEEQHANWNVFHPKSLEWPLHRYDDNRPFWWTYQGKIPPCSINNWPRDGCCGIQWHNKYEYAKCVCVTTEVRQLVQSTEVGGYKHERDSVWTADCEKPEDWLEWVARANWQRRRCNGGGDTVQYCQCRLWAPVCTSHTYTHIHTYTHTHIHTYTYINI